MFVIKTNKESRTHLVVNHEKQNKGQELCDFVKDQSYNDFLLYYSLMLTIISLLSFYHKTSYPNLY